MNGNIFWNQLIKKLEKLEITFLQKTCTLVQLVSKCCVEFLDSLSFFLQMTVKLDQAGCIISSKVLMSWVCAR